MKKAIAIVVVLTVVTVGCASMNNQQQGAAIGAAGGAALGAAVSDGSIWGVLIGAAVGGLAGSAIGKHMDQQARELEQAVPNAEVQRVGEGINMTFDSSLLFAINSAELNPTAKSDLAAAASVFTRYPDTNILIEGHTDNTGTDAINIPLSEKRARAVREFLESQGVAPSRLTEKWYGSSQPKFPNDSPENQARNRRVELAIYANQSMVTDAQDGSVGS
jgi:outer membrane protein OmpA-like peptidoglycan-associated protein